jgi:hypothetical protein
LDRMILWDPRQQQDKQRLEMIQRRATRYVANRYHNTSSVSDILHNGMLNASVLQFLDGLWSGISLSLVSTFARFFVILYATKQTLPSASSREIWILPTNQSKKELISH